jgi:hypothetical protein
MRPYLLVLLGVCLFAVGIGKSRAGGPLEEIAGLYGALQDDPSRWTQERAAGLNVTVLEVPWSQYEPRQDAFDAGCIGRLKQRLAAARTAGFRVVLSPGWQYPPAWIFTLPHSRYVNQYGDTFADPAPGMAGFNAVFNQAVRVRQAIFLRRLVADLGTDFLAVRLGGGWYNELNYPPNRYQGQLNCYWAFDDLAQGRLPGLPAGVSPCPVPGWLPGAAAATAGVDNPARSFVNWYLDSLQNYHDWQIATARSCFAGALVMLYPSWGIRPGQLDAAIADHLAGRTRAEVSGDVARGIDYARFVGGITDPKVVVYSTWLDAHTGNDVGADPDHWEPIHYLSFLALKNPRHLQVWGENTGGNDAAAMAFSFEQARRYHLPGLLWAFDRELYDGHHATLSQLAAEIGSAAQLQSGQH